MRSWWPDWRKLKSSERRVKLKPLLAAELLEPRCLLTDGAAVGLPGIELPEGVVVVERSQWEDSGLTLRQIDGMIHVLRTGTWIDVIDPLPAKNSPALWIVGRDNAADLLTIDVSGGPATPETWSSGEWFGLRFFGGSGPQTDEMRFIEDSPDNVDLFAVERGTEGNRIAMAAWPDWPDNGWEDWREATFDDVELVSCLLQTGRHPDWGPQCGVDFGSEDNVITIDQTDLVGGLVAITDEVTNFTFLARQPLAFVSMGSGNDRLVQMPNVTRPPIIFGRGGHDILIGAARFDDSYWDDQEITGGDTDEAREAFAKATSFDWTTWMSTGTMAPRSTIDTAILATSTELIDSSSDPEWPPLLGQDDFADPSWLEERGASLTSDSDEPPTDHDGTTDGVPREPAEADGMADFTTDLLDSELALLELLQLLADEPA